MTPRRKRPYPREPLVYLLLLASKGFNKNVSATEG